jgi:hypothetical protein
MDSADRQENVMHPAVSFRTTSAADREDGLDGTDPSHMKPMEIAAVQEMANHMDVEHVIVEGRDHEDILVVSYTPSTRVVNPTPMPYHMLYVYSSGKIAEATTNQPVRHRSFRELVEDTRTHAAMSSEQRKLIDECFAPLRRSNTDIPF